MSKELKVWLNVNPYQDRQRAKQYSAAILQKLLQQYHPRDDVFDIQRTENGKPFIESGPHFSYAHCGALHVYVFDDAPIGIDIERINSRRNTQGIAHRHYHETEWQQLQTMKPEQQTQYFFDLWTRKEAWCKHQGGVLWHYLALLDSGSGLNFYDIQSIKGMACSLATTECIDRVDVNVVK